jgi:outer membrane biosynthesis protein TonB
MKPLRLNTSAIGLLLLVVIATGCEHKKPVLVMPQQPPPTAAPQPTATPAPSDSQPAEQQPEPQPTATPVEQPKTGENTAEKPKTRQGRRAAAKKPPVPAGGEKPGTEVARNNSSRKVVPAEKAEPTPPVMGQISPGPTPADAAHSQTSTDQLLQGAEANLNGITRQLSKDEEAMRAQSREFIKQSRIAITDNDLARAHTLAMKARLLSDELIKQR